MCQVVGFVNIGNKQFFDNRQYEDINNIDSNKEYDYTKYDSENINNIEANDEKNASFESDKTDLTKEKDIILKNINNSNSNIIEVNLIDKEKHNFLSEETEEKEFIKGKDDSSESINGNEPKVNKIEFINTDDDLIPLENNDISGETKTNINYIDKRNDDTLIEESNSISIKSRNLDICPNTSVIPTGISSGIIARIPVVLAQLIIPFNLNSIINLPKEALEIKRIKKSLKLTQCTLLQPTSILFVKGFVRKSIEFSTVTSSSNHGIHGDVNHCTVDIPFECSTSVNFFIQPLDLIENTRKEFQYLEQDIKKDGKLSEFNEISEEFFNEAPFCKLLSSKIVDFNECIHCKSESDSSTSDKEKTFIEINEKMVLELKLEVLQNQPIVIPPYINTIIKSLNK